MSLNLLDDAHRHFNPHRQRALRATRPTQCHASEEASQQQALCLTRFGNLAIL
jgi:hypothetical protein